MPPPALPSRRASASPLPLRRPSAPLPRSLSVASTQLAEPAPRPHRRAPTSGSEPPRRPFPPGLGSSLDTAAAEIARVVGTAAGTVDGVLRVVFGQEGVVEVAVRQNTRMFNLHCRLLTSAPDEEIICLSPPHPAHVGPILHTACFLVAKTMKHVPRSEVGQDAHRAAWWPAHRVEMALEAVRRSAGIGGADARDVIHVAEWEWTTAKCLAAIAGEPTFGL